MPKYVTTLEVKEVFMLTKRLNDLKLRDIIFIDDRGRVIFDPAVHTEKLKDWEMTGLCTLDVLREEMEEYESK